MKTFTLLIACIMLLFLSGCKQSNELLTTKELKKFNACLEENQFSDAHEIYIALSWEEMTNANQIITDKLTEIHDSYFGDIIDYQTVCYLLDGYRSLNYVHQSAVDTIQQKIDEDNAYANHFVNAQNLYSDGMLEDAILELKNITSDYRLFDDCITLLNTYTDEYLEQYIKDTTTRFWGFSIFDVQIDDPINYQKENISIYTEIIASLEYAESVTYEDALFITKDSYYNDFVQDTLELSSTVAETEYNDPEYDVEKYRTACEILTIAEDFYSSPKFDQMYDEYKKAEFYASEKYTFDVAQYYADNDDCINAYWTIHDYIYYYENVEFSPYYTSEKAEELREQYKTSYIKQLLVTAKKSADKKDYTEAINILQSYQLNDSPKELNKKISEYKLLCPIALYDIDYVESDDSIKFKNNLTDPYGVSYDKVLCCTLWDGYAYSFSERSRYYNFHQRYNTFKTTVWLDNGQANKKCTLRFYCDDELVKEYSNLSITTNKFDVSIEIKNCNLFKIEVIRDFENFQVPTVYLGNPTLSNE